MIFGIILKDIPINVGEINSQSFHLERSKLEGDLKLLRSQSINQLINQSNQQLIKQSVDQTIGSQAINQSTNHSIKRSINLSRSIKKI